MESPKYFKTIFGANIPLPIFFPDATRAVLKTLDSLDIESTQTLGILVNTYHLTQSPGADVIKKFGGIRTFMSWSGGVISDSGGFQVMSLAKKFNGLKSVTDKGVVFKDLNGKKSLLTPEDSIRIQMNLKSDMVVVLDDFTPPDSDSAKARQTVDRTVLWAKRCKKEFDRICRRQRSTQNKFPYLLAVVQGGPYLDLRKECTQRLVDISFDGLGWGGWPITHGKLDFSTAEIITKYTPKNYFLYGLGVGKPEDIIKLVKDLNWHIFDCVLPTRDARHRRLYVYNADTINNIDVYRSDFYSFYSPDKEKHLQDSHPVSTACDCLLCTCYSRSYLAHLFRIGDMTAGRLATIHNLRFYSILMEKLLNESNKYH